MKTSMKTSFLATLFAATLTGAAGAGAPVVAIMSHPHNSTHEFIAHSYVKWLEMAGASSVRIPFTASDAEIDKIVENTNGFLFMGGAPSLPESARYLYKQAIALQEDTPYAMWGTCLGFQWLTELVADSTHVLTSGFDSENISLALNLTDNAADSRLYNHNGLIELVSENDVTMNNHQAGVKPEKIADNEGKAPADCASHKHARLAPGDLTQSVPDFVVLSTNMDRQGVEFVSSWEHSTLPIFATQYHPEKSNFEYAVSSDGTPYEAIDHSVEGTRYSFELAMFFVAEARKSGERYDGVKSGLKTIEEENEGSLHGEGFEDSILFKVGN